MYELTTAENIYKAVLAGIKKESTAVLKPEGFNRLINGDVLNLWVKEKSDLVDYNQKYIDALRNLIKTEELPAVTIPGSSTDRKFRLNPGYYRLLSVGFVLKGGKMVAGRRLPFDVANRIEDNPYRAANDKRIYYHQQDDLIVNYPENSNVEKARVVYLTYPKPIQYDPTGTATSNGNLTKDQNKEVVDLAVRIFIERVKEERYQTQIMEERLKMQSK